MKRSYKKIKTVLNNLQKIWDDDLILVADNGFLMLVHYESKEVLTDFPNIKCDGGDSGTSEIEGKEYWDVDI